MTALDEVMARIGRGIEMSQAGQREEARTLFTEVWAEIGPDGEALHRCALAHSMADVQDDPRQELRWDLEALRAADGLTDERAAASGVPTSVAAFYPSLHLNLGEVYRKLGDIDLARHHLRLGLDAVGALADDGYGRMITTALTALAKRLGLAEPPTGA